MPYNQAFRVFFVPKDRQSDARPAIILSNPLCKITNTLQKPLYFLYNTLIFAEKFDITKTVCYYAVVTKL